MHIQPLGHLLRAALLALTICFVDQAAAQEDEAAARRQAIDQFYPIMIEHVKQGDYKGARLLCHQAIKWEPTEPGHYYNLACIEARDGNLNMGLAALTKAADLGYSDAAGTAADSDLASLRSSPIYLQQYQKILANGQATGIPTQPTSSQPQTLRANSSPTAVTQPAPHKVTMSTPPVGLYIMTRYWIATRSLETASWYFSPEGMAYENPTGDFSATELAKSKNQGRISLKDGKLVFSNSNGKSDAGDYEPNPDQNAFYWDMGNFVPVKGFIKPGVIAGKWQGGLSSSFSGSTGSVAKTLTLNADGSYTLSSSASISSSSDGSTARAGSTGSNSGTWEAGQYFLTLTGADGSVSRSIAFPFVIKGSEDQPDKIYYGGIMWSRM